MADSTKKYEIPIWQKMNLTVEEAMAYSGIGKIKIYQMTDKEDCSFVLWIGSRRLLKRAKFEEYIEKSYSI